MSKMLEWSTYFQTPDYLEASRMMIMNTDVAPLVVRYIGIRDGHRVLDVGCGTGAFALYLGAHTQAVDYMGIDLSAAFIQRARERARSDTRNGYGFVCGDALQLPFEDGTFDTVVSHTFLTSISEYGRALAEMRRVCKVGGRVASVTAMTIYGQTFGVGEYPASHDYQERLRQLSARVYALYEANDPVANRACGAKPEEMPRAFVKAGLTNIAAYPIGKFFSLSNAALSLEDRRRYILLDHSSARERFIAHRRLPSVQSHITDAEAEEYLILLDRKRDALLRDLDDNEIWEWLGDANLLLVAENGSCRCRQP